MNNGISQLVFFATPIALAYFAGSVYIETFLSIFSISLSEIDVNPIQIASLSFVGLSDIKTIGFIILSSILFLCLSKIQVFDVAKQEKTNLIELSNYIIFIPIAFLLVIQVHSASIDGAYLRASQIWFEERAAHIIFDTNKLTEYRPDSELQWMRLRNCANQPRHLHVISSGGKDFVFCRGGGIDDRVGFLVVLSGQQNQLISVRHLRWRDK